MMHKMEVRTLSRWMGRSRLPSPAILKKNFRNIGTADFSVPLDSRRMFSPPCCNCRNVSQNPVCVPQSIIYVSIKEGLATNRFGLKPSRRRRELQPIAPPQSWTLGGLRVLN